MNTKLVIFLAIAACCYAAPRENEDRIVGGETAIDNAYPYTVSLRSEYREHLCAGAIINSLTVVTTAQCIIGRNSSNTFVAAETSRITGGGGILTNARKLIIHEKYNPKTMDNNIGLVQPNDGIREGPKLKHIPLDYGHIGLGREATLTGWGWNSMQNQTFSNALQVLNVKTITNTECRQRLAGLGTVYDTGLCTFTKIGQGACHGDAGSPLMSEGKLVGIMSWRTSCANGYPDVYNRISAYTSWIDLNKIIDGA